RIADVVTVRQHAVVGIRRDCIWHVGANIQRCVAGAEPLHGSMRKGDALDEQDSSVPCASDTMICRRKAVNGYDDAAASRGAPLREMCGDGLMVRRKDPRGAQ